MEDAAGIRAHPAGSATTFIMRTLILALTMASAWISAGWDAESIPLNTLHAIHTLTKAETRGGVLVAFGATVTMSRRVLTSFGV